MYVYRCIKAFQVNFTCWTFFDEWFCSSFLGESATLWWQEKVLIVQEIFRTIFTSRGCWVLVRSWRILVCTFLSQWLFKCSVVYFLKHKSDSVEATVRFLADTAPYGKVTCIKSDNGTEFTRQSYSALLRRNRFGHETSAPFSPHQNGTAECNWRTLFHMALCMLLESELPKAQPIPLCSSAGSSVEESVF